MEYLYTVLAFVIGFLTALIFLKRMIDSRRDAESIIAHELENKEAQLAGLGLEKAKLEESNRFYQERVQESLRKLAVLEEKEQQFYDLQRRFEQLRTEHEMSQKHHEEKVAMLLSTKEQIEKDFKQITAELYESKSATFQKNNQQHLETLLKPFKEQIQGFEKRIEESFKVEEKERAGLSRELAMLQKLNEQMRQDAVNLTHALKGDNKAQGNWGEIVLERLLEESGLKKGREYEIQAALKNEEGRRYQPDVVVHLPDKKDIIIDSKVSLIAYERFISAENETQKEQALSEHIRSIHAHIEGLSKKSYEDLVGVNSLDFVLLFMPIEGAFLSALEYDSSFYAKAFEKNIMVVSPSTLLVTLRTIENIWRYEHQNQNAMAIAEKAGLLYDKFVGFVNDMEKIGHHIQKTEESYEAAFAKLTKGRGDLVSRVEGLKELGVKAKKEFSQKVKKEALGQES